MIEWVIEEQFESGHSQMCSFWHRFNEDILLLSGVHEALTLWLDKLSTTTSGDLDIWGAYTELSAAFLKMHRAEFRVRSHRIVMLSGLYSDVELELGALGVRLQPYGDEAIVFGEADVETFVRAAKMIAFSLKQLVFSQLVHRFEVMRDGGLYDAVAFTARAQTLRPGLLELHALGLWDACWMLPHVEIARAPLRPSSPQLEQLQPS